jgi:hypothetical protein
MLPLQTYVESDLPLWATWTNTRKGDEAEKDPDEAPDEGEEEPDETEPGESGSK